MERMEKIILKSKGKNIFFIFNRNVIFFFFIFLEVSIVLVPITILRVIKLSVIHHEQHFNGGQGKSGRGKKEGEGV